MPSTCSLGESKVYTGAPEVDITDDGIISVFPIPDVGITCLKPNLAKAEVAITDVGIILQTRSRYKCLKSYLKKPELGIIKETRPRYKFSIQT